MSRGLAISSALYSFVDNVTFEQSIQYYACDITGPGMISMFINMDYEPKDMIGAFQNTRALETSTCMCTTLKEYVHLVSSCDVPADVLLEKAMQFQAGFFGHTFTETVLR